MDFVCDPHVKQVLEFMQENLPADKLVGLRLALRRSLLLFGAAMGPR